MGYKILVVEDDGPVMNLLVNILELEKYEVCQARNGQEALDKLLSFTPDVILSDVMMPVMNGFELLKQMQGDEKTRYIPFLFLSAKKEIQDRVEGLSIGADDYICKPFAIDELLIRIKTRLRKKETLLEAHSHMHGAIIGDLTIFPIVDLVQILRLERKTGEVTLSFKRNKSFIRINQGEVVDVEYGQLSGIQAFRSILEHHEGWFSFQMSPDLFPVKLSISTQELLVESTKQLDEFKHLLSQLPPLDQIYQVSTRQSETVLSVREMKVLYLFDGEKNLGEVLQTSPFDRSKTVKIIGSLLNNGFIEDADHTHVQSKPGPEFVLTSLDEETKNGLCSLLKAHHGIPCILIVSLDETPVNSFIFRLCGPPDKNVHDSSFQKKEKIDFQKIFLLGEYELNIYGLQGIRQFSFLWHVLDRDILGLFLLINKVETLQQEPIKAFLELIANNYKIPAITVLVQDDTTLTDADEAATARELLSRDIQSCRCNSGNSVTKVFKEWLDLVNKS